MPGSWQPPSGWEKRPVVVLGGGVLGRRIATCYVAGGWPVRIRDPSQSQRQAAVDYIKTNIGTYTAITRRAPGQWEAIEDLAEAVKDAWLVVECVPEKLEIKLSTFADLDKCAPQDSILASNSSSFKTGELVERVSDATKARVLNTHFMMPPEALIVELMTDGHTHPEIFPFMVERLKEAGLHPIVALRESTGFVLNRIWAAIKRESLKVLAEGVSTPSEIDRVFKEHYSARDGPCHLMDQVGLDTVESIEEHYIKERGLTRKHLDWLHDNYVAAGKLGKKTPDKGGLYPVPKAGSQTKIFFLNMATKRPIDGKDSLSDVSLHGQVLSFNVDQDQKATEIIGGRVMPDGIDIDSSTQRMIWTSMGKPRDNDGAIYSANLDGSDIRILVPAGSVHTPKECVIDQAARKLYFCDREGLRVMRVNLDGTGLETLIQTGDWQNPSDNEDQTKWCVGIAVSRKLGRFFWTQKGFSKANKGRIFSAKLDMPQGATASNRPDIEVVMSGLPEPIDLEFDDEDSALYWTDRGELPLGNTLNKKHIGVEAPAAERELGMQILAQGFGEAIGVRLDKRNGVAWVADIGGRIWKCDLNTPSKKVKVYEDDEGVFTGLAITYV